jgi:acyl-CoA thioesterase FadM
MYPFLRLWWQMRAARAMPPLGPLEPHVSRHRIMPWDLDPWVELNNGRTLTIYDLGRLPLGHRTGLTTALRANRWGLTVAGASVRYRRRVVAFDRLVMVSRCVGWDARFLYIDQSLWREAEATSQVLIRSAVTSRDGIVPPDRLMAAMGGPAASPALPPWVAAWAEADARRPWPPEKAPPA